MAPARRQPPPATADAGETGRRGAEKPGWRFRGATCRRVAAAKCGCGRDGRSSVRPPVMQSWSYRPLGARHGLFLNIAAVASPGLMAWRGRPVGPATSGDAPPKQVLFFVTVWRGCGWSARRESVAAKACPWSSGAADAVPHCGGLAADVSGALIGEVHGQLASAP